MNKDIPTFSEFSSGFVGLIGPPNVGKSTLLNTILGEKVSIVTPKPQTTRSRIHGIFNAPHTQIVFIDVPGIHKPQEKLHKIMVKTALAVLQDADIIVCMFPPKPPSASEKFIVKLLKQTTKLSILAINKVDLIKKEQILSIIDMYRQLLDFTEIIPISALKNINVDKLVSLITPLLPSVPPPFPPDTITDKTQNFQISEIIREKIFLYTQKEIPYAVGIIVDDIKEDQSRSITTIFVTVMVEKSSHKGIIIGKSGTKLKKIGIMARMEIEKLLNTKVFLDLKIKHVPKWKENPFLLTKMGLH